MADRRIKMIVLEGLLPEDLLTLKAGGFFDGAAMAMPAGIAGQEAQIRVPEKRVIGSVPWAPCDTDEPAPAPKPAAPTTPTPAEVIAETKAQDAAERAADAAAAAPTQASLLDRKPAPTPVPAPAAPEAASAPPPGSLPEAVLVELVGAKKLRDVIEKMRAAGLKTIEEIVVEAQAIRSSVPILSRIDPAQVEDRIRRTCEAMA